MKNILEVNFMRYPSNPHIYPIIYLHKAKGNLPYTFINEKLKIDFRDSDYEKVEFERPITKLESFEYFQVEYFKTSCKFSTLKDARKYLYELYLKEYADKYDYYETTFSKIQPDSLVIKDSKIIHGNLKFLEE